MFKDSSVFYYFNYRGQNINFYTCISSNTIFVYFLNSLQQQQNQKNISTADMKLKPMQRPTNPPVLAINVISGIATSLLIVVTYGLCTMTWTKAKL